MGLFLVGYAGSTTMTMGRPYTLLSVAAVAVGGTDFSGGKGSYVSGFIGAFVLIVLTTILQAMNVPEGLRSVIRGVLLITIMILNIMSSRNKN
jgi:ribose transport system permease protein